MNPGGKKGNWIWDEGEAFEDTGLDGRLNDDEGMATLRWPSAGRSGGRDPC